MQAVIGAVAPTLLRAAGSAATNIVGAGIGNAASRAATAGRNYDDVLNHAQSLGYDLNELANAAAQRAQNDTKFQQGVGMENLAFSRGLNADQMRQQTYNNMAQNEQQNRFNAAQGLVDAYNNARQTNANLMANTLRF
ncbi:MAG: hypothetical protein RMZ41_003240 [Nostoc sp. DedVER02]|uniref:hypothetical protein n=1 Tax=unclassified Nostoc TaxID=2593658 RepID=UPI002AD5705B|nr:MULTISPECIES: hypothetical protein [unclassified Nostoc]MDZ7986829.1 hypothetical protein [Nostoc sp. DedVER02]MDZ8115731.1 hypothetical protein [Nostoc sp. DedVER01b]